MTGRRCAKTCTTLPMDCLCRSRRKIFGTLTLDKVIRAGGGRRTLGSVVQLQAHDDGYIARPEGERLLSSLRSALADDAQAQLRWQEGGHAAAFLQQQAVLVPAIVDAIDAL